MFWVVVVAQDRLGDNRLFSILALVPVPSMANGYSLAGGSKTGENLCKYNVFENCMFLLCKHVNKKYKSTLPLVHFIFK